MATKVEDEFIRDDETLLSGTGWTANGLTLVNQSVTPTSLIGEPNPPTTDITYGFGWGFLSGTKFAPLSPNQEIEGHVFSAIESIPSTLCTSLVISGNFGTFTLNQSHNRVVGTKVLIDVGSGFTGYTPSISQRWVATITGDATFVVDFGEPIVESTPLGDPPTLGFVFSQDVFARVIARLDDSVTSTSYNPFAGYGLTLQWDSNNVRTLCIDKINRSGGGWVRVAATTVNLHKVSNTDLNVIQTIRLTVEDLPTGVKIRGYVNQSTDTSPDVEYTDLGHGDTSYFPWHKESGYFGLELGAQLVACEYFKAEDDWTYPPDDTWTGRTLSEMRDELEFELARGGTPNITTNTMNYYIRKSHDSFRNEIGDLALFLRRERNFTLTFDNHNIASLTDEIDSVQTIYDAETREILPFQILDYGDNKGFKLRIQRAPAGGTRIYAISYMLRPGQLRDDDDRSWVPREYDEAITLGAARMVASKSSNKGWVQDLKERYAFAMRGVKKSMNRLKRQENAGFHIRRHRSYRRLSRYAPDGNPDFLYGRF